MGRMMSNTLPCHSEERSDEESLKGRATLYLQRLKQIEHIRDSLRHAQGMLRFAQNDTSVQSVITHYKNSKFRYKMQVIAADCSRGEMLLLPRDIAYYGIQPEKLGVARAVRMSIPFFGMVQFELNSTFTK